MDWKGERGLEVERNLEGEVDWKGNVDCKGSVDWNISWKGRTDGQKVGPTNDRTVCRMDG